VAWTRRARAGGSKLDGAEQACAPGAESGDWRVPLAALDELLQSGAWHTASATLWLSNHFARYALIPWVEGLSGAERSAQVRQCFVKLYGARAEGWTLRLSDDRYGVAQVASAVDTELLAALRDSARRARLRLTSIRCGFMEAFNAHRASLAGEALWFIDAEPGRACIAHLAAGQWRSIRSCRLGAEWDRELPALLARERYLHGVSAGASKVYLHGPALVGEGLVSGEWDEQGLRLARAVCVAATPAPAAKVAVA
jgi:hypothetical protein